MAADDETMRKSNVEGTRHVVEFANAHEVGRFHHVSLDRGRRRLQGHVAGGDVRRGPEAAARLPPDEVRVGEGRARRGQDEAARVPPGDRARPLGDGRDGQDRRPVLLLQAAPAVAQGAAAVVPARRPRGRPDEHGAGGLRREGDGPHRPPARRRAARRHVPPDEPRADDGRPGAEHLRQGRARAAVRDAHRQQSDERDPEAGARGLQAAATGEADPPAGAQGPRHPGERDREPRLLLHVRLARHAARARGHRHRGAAAVVVRGAAVGLLGAQHGPRALPRALAGELDRGQEDHDHRRIVRDRARGRAEGRRRRRLRAARLAHAREARGGRRAGARARRRGARAPGRPVRPRRHPADGATR